MVVVGASEGAQILKVGSLYSSVRSTGNTNKRFPFPYSLFLPLHVIAFFFFIIIIITHFFFLLLLLYILLCLCNFIIFSSLSPSLYLPFSLFFFIVMFFSCGLFLLLFYSSTFTRTKPHEKQPFSASISLTPPPSIDRPCTSSITSIILSSFSCCSSSPSYSSSSFPSSSCSCSSPSFSR